MKKTLLLTILAIVALTCLSGDVQAAQILAADHPIVAQSFNQMPLAFTKNMGQWDDRVLFRASSGGATMWFTKEGVTYQFIRHTANPIGAALAAARDDGLNHAGKGDREGRPYDHADQFSHEKDSVEQLVLSAKFVGGNPNPEVVAEGQMEYKCNYFLGNDESKWRTDVPNYEAITLKDVYPGIDVRYSDGGVGQAAYELIVASGADMSQIQVAYEGVEATTIDADGQLIVQTKWGNMTAAIGSSAQNAGPTSLRLAQSTDDTYGIKSGYQNNNQALSAATILVYSTYLGGGSYDEGFGIAVDESGNAYVTGQTYSSNFPTLNPFQTDQGGNDAFVTKLSSSGNSLIYSTYLGGGGSEAGWGVAVDGSSNAYVTGGTSSSDFPTSNAYQTDQGGNDVFVTKLSSSGNSLIFSTYLGGGGSETGWGVAVDGNNNAYVTGSTESFAFPTLNPYQTDQGQYDADAFVTKLSSSGNSLVYSTYLGGNNDDHAYGIAVDNSGNAYVTGVTVSTNFPTIYPYQTAQGGADAIVTKFSSAGNSLVYSTYLGGESDDYGYGIAVDSSGSAYVTGETESSNFPTLYPYQMDQGGPDAFVTRLINSGNMLIHSTYLGGGGYDRGSDIAIDNSGNAYVTGETHSSNFPTLNPYQTYQGGIDAFVIKLYSFGSTLIYSTYLGGGVTDEGRGIAVDGSGNAYVIGSTYSSNFPTLNPYQTDQGTEDAIVTKLRYFPCIECGDANSDGVINIGDASFLIAYIYAGGSAPGNCNYPVGKGDANGDGSVNVLDVNYLIAYIFSSGPCPHCQGGPRWFGL